MDNRNMGDRNTGDRDRPESARGARRYGPSSSSSSSNNPPPADPRPRPQAWSEVSDDESQIPRAQYPPNQPGSQPYPPRRTTPPRNTPPPTAVFPSQQPYPGARPEIDPTRGQPPYARAQGNVRRPGPGAPGSAGLPPRRSVAGTSTPRRANPQLIVGRVVIAALSLVVLIASGVIWGLDRTTGGESQALDKVGNSGVATDSSGAPIIKGRNILLVGSDSRTDVEGNALTGAELAALGTTDTDGVNTDTIMVIHIPEGGGRATSVSIPRDTWTYDPPANRNPKCVLTAGTYDYSFPNKINSYYGVAKACEEYDLVQAGVTDRAERERVSNETGRTVLIDAVQRLSGLKIDSYAEVNLFGFYLLSEAIGGVPVCLINDVQDADSGANFKAGPQTVSGSDALAFVRQRHGLPGGDLDRIKRQQAFLAGALDKVISADVLTSPSALGSLITAADRSIVLSDGFSLLDLAAQMADLSSGNVNFVTIPTLGGRNIDGKDALDVDPAKVKEFFASLDSIGGSAATASSGSQTAKPTIDPRAVIVDVLNGTNTSGLATAVSTTLANNGFTRGRIGDFEGDLQPTTTVRYRDGDQDLATLVQKSLGFGSIQADETVDPGKVVVVLGADAPAPPSGLWAGRQLAAQFAGLIELAATTQADDPINAAAPGCVN